MKAEKEGKESQSEVTRPSTKKDNKENRMEKKREELKWTKRASLRWTREKREERRRGEGVMITSQGKKGGHFYM